MKKFGMLYNRVGKEYRIVLTWDDFLRDLDSHLICRKDNKEMYHVYYVNRVGKIGNATSSTLDVDITTGYGPETVSVKKNDDCEFNYYVYKYSYGDILESGAKVKVYYRNKSIDVYDIEKDGYVKDEHWYVFSIKDGKITESKQK